jgi:hypothetical protein
MGAATTGVDLAEENIGVAREHARRDVDLSVALGAAA